LAHFEAKGKKYFYDGLEEYFHRSNKCIQLKKDYIETEKKICRIISFKTLSFHELLDPPSYVAQNFYVSKRGLFFLSDRITRKLLDQLFCYFFIVCF
jgi:hypothetical protein